MVSRIMAVICVLVLFSSTALAENQPKGKGLFTWNLFSWDYLQTDPSLIRLFKEVGNFETRTRMELQTGHGFGLGDTFDLKFNSGDHPSNSSSYRGDKFTDSLGRGYGGNQAGFWDTQSWVVNTLYDIRMNSIFTPYIGFGLGLAWQQRTLKRFGGTVRGLRDGYDHWLAYQGLMGMTSNLSENLNIGVGYRYLGAPDSAYRQATTLTGAHNFEVGAHYAF